MDLNTKKEIYYEWKSLVNMTYSALKTYYNSEDGKTSGLSLEESVKLNIRNGRASARALLKMIPKAKTFNSANTNWTRGEWLWAVAQIAFIKRMRGVKGPLYKDFKRTAKLKSLLIWGHNPEWI